MQLFQAEVRAAIGGGDHCTLCTLLTEGDDSRIQSFLRELGNDGHVLEPIWDAWGFCPWHMWKVAWIEHTQRGAVLTMALLAQELLRRLAQALATTDTVAPGSIPVPPAPGNACSLCQRIFESQTHWLDWLLANGMLLAPNQEPSPLLPVKPRFCLPHLGRVYRYARQQRQSKRTLIAERLDAARASLSRRVARRYRSPTQPDTSNEELVRLALPSVHNQDLPWQDYVMGIIARVAGGCALTPQFPSASPTKLHAAAPLPGISAASLDTPERCWLCLEELRQATALCDEKIHDQVVRLAAGGVAIGPPCHGHAWLLAERFMLLETGSDSSRSESGVKPSVSHDVSTASFVDPEHMRRLRECLAHLERSYDEQFSMAQPLPSTRSGEKMGPSEITSERHCMVCDVCEHALEQQVQESIHTRTFLSGRDTAPESNEHLCLRHWHVFDRAAHQQGRHNIAEQLRFAQYAWQQAVSQDLEMYLRSFSVSTRDPQAPPPGPRAWQRALVVLAGLPPGAP
jgi:hypothetical protein